MNQKQRDYLIKRLETIKNEKLSSVIIGEPDYKPFLKKFKLRSDKDLLYILKKEINRNIDNANNYHSYNYVKGERVKGNVDHLSISISNFNISLEQALTNFEEVTKDYREYCTKFYDKGKDRKELIEKKFVEMTDKIIFANDYIEMSLLIDEFLKF